MSQTERIAGIAPDRPGGEEFYFMPARLQINLCFVCSCSLNDMTAITIDYGDYGDSAAQARTASSHPTMRSTESAAIPRNNASTILPPSYKFSGRTWDRLATMVWAHWSP